MRVRGPAQADVPLQHRVEPERIGERQVPIGKTAQYGLGGLQFGRPPGGAFRGEPELRSRPENACTGGIEMPENHP